MVAAMGQGSIARVILTAGLLALGLTLGGCTKCGPIWDDWSPRSCRSAPP